VEILHAVKTGTSSTLLESQNKLFVFVIVFSLTLPSTSIALYILILVLYILTIILFVLIYCSILLLVGLSIFPHPSNEAIVHLNSYLRGIKRRTLELLIRNSASFLF